MNKDVNNGQSRREFLGRSVAALAAASFLPSAFSCTGKSVAAPAPVDTAAEAGKVNSKFGGVQIGTITYSWRSMPGGLENIIKYCQEANISSFSARPRIALRMGEVFFTHSSGQSRHFSTVTLRTLSSSLPDCNLLK